MGWDFWGSDGWVYFSSAAANWIRVLETGGPVEVVNRAGQRGVRLEYDWPEVLPNGKVSSDRSRSWRSSLTTASLAVLDLGNARDTGPRRSGVYARYLSTGHLLYVTADGSLFARPFDDGSTRDSPVPSRGISDPDDGWLRLSVNSTSPKTATFIYQAGAGAEHQIVCGRSDARVAEPVDAELERHLPESRVVTRRNSARYGHGCQ